MIWNTASWDARDGRYRPSAWVHGPWEAVEELRPLVPAGETMAQMALRWILMSDAVTCAVPGAKRPAQVEDTLRAADLPALPNETMEKIRKIYDRRIRPDVHAQW